MSQQLTNGPAYHCQLFCRLHVAFTRPPGVRDCCGDGLLDAPTEAMHGGEPDSGL